LQAILQEKEEKKREKEKRKEEEEEEAKIPFKKETILVTD
jgi:hypothetical protein